MEKPRYAAAFQRLAQDAQTAALRGDKRFDTGDITTTRLGWELWGEVAKQYRLMAQGAELSLDALARQREIIAVRRRQIADGKLRATAWTWRCGHIDSKHGRCIREAGHSGLCQPVDL